MLPVPYWAWINKVNDVARILSSHSGEKMILIPEDIDDIEGKRENIRKRICKCATQKFGIVSLVPANEIAKEWEKDGAIRADKDN